MAGTPDRALLLPVNRLFGTGTVAGLSEDELLERFLTAHDEVAFEALLARHGPVVLQVCRRLLDDPHDVDDAFQATFLILVKKARVIQNRALLGNWLYGVAYRVASRARAKAARARSLAMTDRHEPAVETANNLEWTELRPLIDLELHRLPARYRAPIVLCHLEGMTHEQAASCLRCPVGTVRSRLARGRERMRRRLVRQGITLSGAIIGTALSAEHASATVSEALCHSTAKVATSFAEGKPNALTAAITHLMTGDPEPMFLANLRLFLATVIVLGGIAAGAAGLAYWLTPDPRAKAATQSRQEEKPAPPVKRDSLIGRKLKERLELAKRIYQNRTTLYTHGELAYNALEPALRRLLEAELELCETKGDRVAVLEKHLKIYVTLESTALKRVEARQVSQLEIDEIKFDRLGLEVMLEREQSRE
jgi:RNA polymerase sigma factor (sigma-70 family)